MGVRRTPLRLTSQEPASVSTVALFAAPQGGREEEAGIGGWDGFAQAVLYSKRIPNRRRAEKPRACSNTVLESLQECCRTVQENPKRIP